jgi:hypothetical protein
MTSMVLLKHDKNYGIAVHIPKETILKYMAAKIEIVKPACLFFFFTYSGNFPIGPCILGSRCLVTATQILAQLFLLPSDSAVFVVVVVVTLRVW